MEKELKKELRKLEKAIKKGERSSMERNYRVLYDLYMENEEHLENDFSDDIWERLEECKFELSMMG